MNFTFDASKTQSVGNQAPGSVQNQPKPGGLFGATLGGAPSSTFGSPAATTPGLNLGTPATGLTFGTPGSTAPATLKFDVGKGTPLTTGFGAATFSGGALGTTSTAATTTGALTFGVPKTTTTTGFALGSAVSTAASTTPKLTFGSSIPPNTIFSLGGLTATPAATTATSTTATGFGLTPATSQTGTTLGVAAPTLGFSLTPSTGAQSLTSAFGQTSVAPAAVTTTASTGFALSGATTAPSTGFNLGSGAASTISSGFALNKTTTTQAATTTAAPNTAPQTSLGTITTVSSASSGQVGTMNFCQLEESINKWTLELEEQEKVFVNQATQVNAWDILLIANGEKITSLNQEVERVKLEQQHLEHELDYVVGQQKELQDCLVPLEKELASRSVADPERDYTYRLSENLDKQLKQMSQDLKEIIEHLNEANRSQDSSDPIVQIGKILNAHMNSLQWLDQKTTVLGQKIQQIDQMHQNFRQENERSFNLAYN